MRLGKHPRDEHEHDVTHTNKPRASATGHPDSAIPAATTTKERQVPLQQRDRIAASGSEGSLISGVSTKAKQPDGLGSRATSHGLSMRLQAGPSGLPRSATNMARGSPSFSLNRSRSASPSSSSTLSSSSASSDSEILSNERVMPARQKMRLEQQSEINSYLRAREPLARPPSELDGESIRLKVTRNFDKTDLEPFIAAREARTPHHHEPADDFVPRGEKNLYSCRLIR